MSLTSLKAFSPAKAATVNVVPTSASQNLVLNEEAAFGPAGYNVRVFNGSNSTVFIRFGGAAQAAATTDVPIASGAVEVFGLRGGDTSVGVISTGTPTGNIYFTVGEGV